MRARFCRACGVRRRGVLRGRTEESSPLAPRWPSLPARQLRALLVVLLILCIACPVTTHAATIPREAKAYRSLLVRVARVEWGMAAPVATFAAQVHQESGWNPDAVSPVGAEGLAQFMPATARWLPQVAPQTGEPMPRNPAWALRAMVAYDRWLHERVSAATPCDRMAMTLAAYNGGLGWVQRDARLAASRGFDPRRWWDNVESVNAGRSRAAFTENRGYPRRTLHTLEPMYEAAGWGAGSCLTPQGGHS